MIICKYRVCVRRLLLYRLLKSSIQNSSDRQNIKIFLVVNSEFVMSGGFSKLIKERGRYTIYQEAITTTPLNCHWTVAIEY